MERKVIEITNFLEWGGGNLGWDHQVGLLEQVTAYRNLSPQQITLSRRLPWYKPLLGLVKGAV